MKIIKILASAFIFVALNANSFAMDKSNNTSNVIESNTSEIVSTLVVNGRNKSLRDDVIVKVIDTSEKAVPFFANAGRNKKPINLYLSMY